MEYNDLKRNYRNICFIEGMCIKDIYFEVGPGEVFEERRKAKQSNMLNVGKSYGK